MSSRLNLLYTHIFLYSILYSYILYRFQRDSVSNIVLSLINVYITTGIMYYRYFILVLRSSVSCRII